MSKSILMRSLSTARKHFVNSSAFTFLSECSKQSPEIDMTSSISISPPPNSFAKRISSDDLIYGISRNLSKGLSSGDPESLDSVKRFFNKYGVACNQNNVSLNPGILASVAKTYDILGLKKSGKVIVPTPTFGYYFQQFKDEGVDFEILPTKKEDNFLIDADRLDSLIGETKAKTLLLCYPNNPTGVALPKHNAEAIANIAKKRDIFVISDEVFIGNNLLDRDKHCPIASIDGMLERSLTLTSISKMMGSPNIRTGICVGPERIVSRFKLLGGYPALDQKIITTALEETEENSQYLENDRQKYLSNIALIKDRVSDLNNRLRSKFPEDGEDKIFVKPFIENPEAGNVYLLDFSGLKGKMHDRSVMNTGLDVAKWLLKEASVGTVPGECYAFDEKEMLVRIALGHPQEEINKAFDNRCEAVTKIHLAPKHLPKVSSNDSRDITI